MMKMCCIFKNKIQEGKYWEKHIAEKSVLNVNTENRLTVPDVKNTAERTENVKLPSAVKINGMRRAAIAREIPIVRY